MTIYQRLHAADGTRLAQAYESIVHGERGSYLEILRGNIIWERFHVPAGQEWRLNDPEWKDKVYYIEHRTRGPSNVKLYVQVKTVSYADYKVGRCYISIDDVVEKDAILAHEAKS